MTSRLASLVLLLLLVAQSACFERGGGKPRAGAALADDAQPAPPDAGITVTDVGWLTRDLDGTADPTATITLALEAEPISLDPFAAADAAAARVLGDIYEGLLCAQPGQAPTACLAERWNVSADGLTWHFWLRPGVTFHDGARLTAADVLASFRAPGRGATATGPLAAVLDDLASITSPRASEVVLRFTGTRGTRAYDLSLIPIAPAARIRSSDLASHPLGTGPLAFSSWKRGESIELTRHPAYWGEPARAAVIRHRITADRAEAIRLLAAGTIDVVLQVPIPDALAATASAPSLVRFRYEQPAFLAAIYNARRPSLARPETRRALTALLDRPGIARTILGGARVPSGPWAPASREADAQVSPIPFDRALAARLLGTSRPSLQLLVPQGSPTSARIADIWASDARGLSTLTVIPIPFSDLLARLSSGDFDIAITSLSGGPDVDLWSRLSSHAPPSEAWTGLSDPTLDTLLETHRTEPNPDIRPLHARAVHRHLADLAPMAFIAIDTRAGLARPHLGGLLTRHALIPRPRALWRSK